jgi:hypothetical protein
MTGAMGDLLRSNLDKTERAITLVAASHDYLPEQTAEMFSLVSGQFGAELAGLAIRLKSEK